MQELDQFFGSVVKPESKERFDDAKLDKFVRNLSYVCAKDFGWSQEDFESCELPFLFGLLKARDEDIKEQNKQSRRKR